MLPKYTNACQVTAEHFCYHFDSDGQNHNFNHFADSI